MKSDARKRLEKCIFVSLFTVMTFLLFQQCTYSVSMAHTDGTADDVIDETQSTSPVISPEISIPVSAIPGV